ncbi:MAG: CocE/NonD family hydrolase [Deltaproteobacteria bacterium]|nr:CocE/NonD family hydrolase [Deltaproteobacteria bacterium]
MYRILIALALIVAGQTFPGCTSSGSTPPDDAGDGNEMDSGNEDGGEIDDAGGLDAADTAAGDEDFPCGTARVREELGIPTLDGYQLSAFLDRPAQIDCRLPTILLQTPYDKENAWNMFFGSDRVLRPLFNSPHYNYVVVDWRGSHASKDLPHPGDGAWMAQDSYDTVEWIAARTWSNGQIGTWGVSALCGAQYRTAAGPINNASHPDFRDEPPPHLIAMVPIMCAMRMGFDQTYPGGVLRHDWAMALDILGYGVRKLFEENPRKNLLWDLVDTSIPVTRMQVPALVISGWWDLMPKHTLAAFEELVSASDPTVRAQHRLLIGPWIHFACGGEIGEGAFRPLTEAERAYMDVDRKIDLDSLAFFDHHLRGIDNEVTSWAPIRYHHENAGWQTAPDWPPAGGQTRTLYLNDQARLVDNPPVSGSLLLPYDPADPSPSLGGSTLSPYNCVGDPNPLICMLTPSQDNLLLHGPLSQAELSARPDQITFQTEALSEPLVLLGGLRLHLDVSTDGADTDIVVRILDIDQAGDKRLIGDGIQRLSARDGQRSYSEVLPAVRYSMTVIP